ncbi:MAG TPA: endonuclease/exonuclease/phosphatase family protein [Polyangiaceae bacterium]|nr:endonuclease/exonuclease/phosphatase family protein [Polyangiaceae bacterium]
MRLATSLFLALGLAAVTACGDSGTTSTGSTSGTGGGGTGGSGGGMLTGKPLKIANWNVHNLLNDQNDSSAPDETIETTAKYQAHIQAVAGVLDALDPDVAVLAEVENQSTLDDLNAALDNRYVEARIIDANDPRGVDIAALSKIPFSDVVSHATDQFTVEGTTAPTYTFARDAVEYHFSFEGQDVVLVGVHFRSKGPPDDANKRLAEAERARAIADSLTDANPDLAVAILGDFNDLTDSPPFDAVAGKDPDLYTDAAVNVAEGDRWTFDFMGAHELIDHQMANPKLGSHLDKANVVIRHGTDVGTASDHAPTMATYLF